MDAKDRRIAELEAQVQRLGQALAQALERLAQHERAAARQAGPFRRESNQKLPPEQHKKPGRPPGHEGTYRQAPAVIDQVIDLPLQRCPRCGGPVHDVQALEQIIEEVAPLRPQVVKLITRQGCCGRCGEVAATHPLQRSTAGGCAKVQLGPRAVALAAVLNKSCGLTMRKTVRVLRELVGLKLSAGGLSQTIDRLADRCRGDYQQLIEQLRRSDAVHADETSWWVGSPGHWLWTFTNADTTVYHVDNRSAQVVRDLLGEEFAGVLVSDCLSSYDPIACRKHKCFAHHLRAIRAAQKLPGGESDYLEQWRGLFRAATVLWKLRAGLPPPIFVEKCDHLERCKDQLLDQPVGTPAEVKVRDRLIKHRPHLLRCLHEPAAEPTNNRAERALRPAVIARKLSCGNKTPRGQRTWQTLASLAVTWTQRGTDPVEQFAQRASILPAG